MNQVRFTLPESKCDAADFSHSQQEAPENLLNRLDGLQFTFTVSYQSFLSGLIFLEPFPVHLAGTSLNLPSLNG
jgi:hypothetical protein